LELQSELNEMRTKILVSKVSELTNSKPGEISPTKNEPQAEVEPVEPEADQEPEKDP
jgi:hypothetical protein